MSDNPHAEYDHVTTGVKREGHRFHITIRLWNSTNDNEHWEVSKRWWASEAEARTAATMVANQMRDRVLGSVR
jgi:hypothetical protein